MKIVENVVKEVEEIIGYKCDSCKDDIKISGCFFKMDLTTITYSHPHGPYGDNKEYELHVCSKKCLRECLKEVQFDANVHLSQKMIKELTGEKE